MYTAVADLHLHVLINDLDLHDDLDLHVLINDLDLHTNTTHALLTTALVRLGGTERGIMKLPTGSPTKIGTGSMVSPNIGTGVMIEPVHTTKGIAVMIGPTRIGTGVMTGPTRIGTWVMACPTKIGSTATLDPSSIT